jgi:hypothetical protein
MRRDADDYYEQLLKKVGKKWAREREREREREIKLSEQVNH